MKKQILQFALAGLFAATASAQTYTLQILHNNDGESALLPTDINGSDYGGIAYFKSLVDDRRAYATTQGWQSMTLSSGDNFLAGKNFFVSQSSGTYYDALALDAIDYDAIILGNHDFDFGTSTLKSIVDNVSNSPFISANLDFSNDGNLNPLVGSKIFSSTIVNRDFGGSIGQKSFGIVGATTPLLSSISSPGLVDVNPVVASAQAEIDDLRNNHGVDHVIFVSHLQDVSEDKAIMTQLTGVDVAIAGGGDELLASPGNVGTGYQGLRPNDVISNPYPETADDGVTPIVTTAGSYSYLGEFTVEFNVADGSIASVNGNPIVVGENTTLSDGSTPLTQDATVLANIQQPVADGVAALDSNIIATSEVVLEGGKDKLRSRETNAGNLVADAQFAAANSRAAGVGATAPDFAMANTGGIRHDDGVIGSDGNFSEGNAFDISAFSNALGIIEITRDDLLLLLEKTVSDIVLVNGTPTRQGAETGAFAAFSDQVEFIYDATAQPIELSDTENPDGTYDVDIAGERVIDFVVDGVSIIDDGVVVPGDDIAIAINAFSAQNGGDRYFFNMTDAEKVAMFTGVGITDNAALAEYVEGLGVIPAADYAVGGEGRITPVPEPAAFGGLFGLIALLVARRRVA